MYYIQASVHTCVYTYTQMDTITVYEAGTCILASRGRTFGIPSTPEGLHE